VSERDVLRETDDENPRLAALERYDVLDTPPEEAFDRITRLTRQIFDVSISTVTLIDGHRQWFKSRQGVEVAETELSQSLCQIAVVNGEPLIVEDALVHPTVYDHPAVIEGMKLRFYAGMPLRTPDGHVIGTLCAADTVPRTFSTRDQGILTDLAQFVVSELELRTLAMTDALTGALSRRAFREEAARAIGLARRHGTELSVMMIDLDHFKRVNDTYGHQFGDRLLVEVISTLRSNARHSDIIGRLGGEEFAVVLHQSSASAALDVAEKLRSAVARLRIDHVDGPVSATISVGVAGLDRTTQDIDTLLERADAALYVAKSDGRNRCIRWQSPAQPIPADARRRVLKGGRIAFNGGRSTMDCTVRTLSETGAGLDFISTADVPDRFKLLIMADEFSRICRVRVRGDRRIEVDFD
jgi:diguanylate cyclase (GGDEF)-like protein